MFLPVQVLDVNDKRGPIPFLNRLVNDTQQSIYRHREEMVLIVVQASRCTIFHPIQLIYNFRLCRSASLIPSISHERYYLSGKLVLKQGMHAFSCLMRRGRADCRFIGTPTQSTRELSGPPGNFFPPMIQTILRAEHAEMIMTRLNPNPLVIFNRHSNAESKTRAQWCACLPSNRAKPFQHNSARTHIRTSTYVELPIHCNCLEKG